MVVVSNHNSPHFPSENNIDGIFEEALEMNVDGGLQLSDIHVFLLQIVMQLRKHLTLAGSREEK